MAARRDRCCRHRTGRCRGRRPVWLRDAAGREREVATIDLAPSAGFLGFTVAPDGSSIVYATAAFTTTVMMIENFQ